MGRAANIGELFIVAWRLCDCLQILEVRLKSFRENQIADIVTRKFGVMTGMLLCFVAKQEKADWNIDAIFHAWRRRKPSRSTFTQIITDMEAVGWVKKVAGAKKSEVFLEINPDLIIEEIGLKVDFGESATDECWLFTRGFFDGELLFDREFHASEE